MPTPADWQLARYEDGFLTIGLQPPVPIGGWEIQLTVKKRFGGTTPLIVKSLTSGYMNVSGLTILNSGNGTIRAQINSPDTSGLAYGNYAYTVDRLTSGSSTCLSEGYFMVMPR